MPPTRGGHHPSSIIHHTFAFYVLALLFFALGLMSKQMLVTVPFVLLLLDYWPLERIGTKKSNRTNETRTDDSPLSSWGRLLLEKAPFFALAVVASIVTFSVQRRAGAV